MSLPLGFDEALRQILKEFNIQMIGTLSKNARLSYLSGGLDALSEINRMNEYAMRSVNVAALRYADVYGDLLRTEGASVINGKKVPWMANSTTTMKDDLTSMLKKAIESGQPLGKKERSSGGYTKGTLADDLSVYFDARKSQASTVARTEVFRIQNTGRLDQWKGQGITRVNVHDGDYDPECIAANGQTWPIEYAMEHTSEHPNCGRVFTAVIEGFKARPVAPRNQGANPEWLRDNMFSSV
jgi:hypothetical protein